MSLAMPYTLFGAGNRAIEVQKTRGKHTASDVAVEIGSQSM